MEQMQQRDNRAPAMLKVNKTAKIDQESNSFELCVIAQPIVPYHFAKRVCAHYDYTNSGTTDTQQFCFVHSMIA
jgi:hypothetical protein